MEFDPKKSGYTEVANDAVLETRGVSSLIILNEGDIITPKFFGQKPFLNRDGSPRKNDNGEDAVIFGFACTVNGEQRDIPLATFNPYCKDRANILAGTKFGQDMLQSSNDKVRKDLIMKGPLKVIKKTDVKFKKWGSEDLRDGIVYIFDYS